MLKKMRQCRLNFADNRYDCEAGIIGEHYATELIVTPPAIMPTEAVYRLCFEPGGLSEIILQTTDGAFSYPLPSAVTATSCCCVTLIGYVGSEQVYKSRMVRLRFSQTADGDNSIDLQQPGIVDEVNQNTAARHSHANKAVLDKFAESKDGKPTYDGKALGGGASDFTIKMAVASGEDGYTVTSCDATVEQIDAAVAAKKRVVLIATDTASGLFWEMPIIFGSQGNSYEFGTFLEGQVIVSFVDKVGENESKWQFMLTKIAAEAVNYSNAALSYVSTVGEALDKLVSDSHTHKNKGTLDKLSDSNGKLQYNGKAIGGGGDDNGIFKIPMTLTALEDGVYTVECATTKAEIQAAYAAGKTLEVVATDNVNNLVMVIPLLYTVDGVYVFSVTITNGIQAIFYTDEGDDGLWVVTMVGGVSAEEVGFSNATYPDLTTVDAALVKALPRLVEKTTATVNLTLADNTEYRLTNAQDVWVSYPSTNFESWIKVTFAETGTYIFRLPSASKYIGTAPTFGNGETWEISIKDGVVIAQKVGDGT